MTGRKTIARAARLIAALSLLVGSGVGSGAAADPALLFDWSRARCARWDIPDAPARFWRDAAGKVHMLAGNEANRQSTGPDLDRLKHGCDVIYAGGENPDPAARDDRVWIVSVFTRDGARIEALGHAEYHGHRHGGACAAGDYMACWRNAIVALESDDGGQSFHRVPGPPVASLPYRYDRNQTRRSGYFNPSNMIAAGGYLHVFFFAEAYGAQKRGTCLARRPLDGGPQDWRAWDGAGFTVRFADPYADPNADPYAAPIATSRAGPDAGRTDSPGNAPENAPVTAPERHVCTPLPGVPANLTSVVFQPATGRYLAVSPMVAEEDGRRISGIWAFTSTDLVHWQNRVLLAQMPLLWARDCAADFAYAYPSLVDPDSTSPTFATVDADFWLTFVRMALDDACRVGPERDLVRVDVNWPAQATAPPAVQAPSADR